MALPASLPMGPVPIPQDATSTAAVTRAQDKSPWPPRMVTSGKQESLPLHSPHGPLLMTLIRLCWLHWAFSSSHSLL